MAQGYAASSTCQRIQSGLNDLDMAGLAEIADDLLASIAHGLRTDPARIVALASPAGIRPLHVAVVGGLVDAVRSACAHGADPNACAGTSEQPLDAMCIEASPLVLASWTADRDAGAAIVDILVAAGARVDGTVGEYGCTALLDAVARGNIPVTDRLIRHGADVRARFSCADDVGLISMTTDPAMIACLATAGADPSAASAHGVTPLHAAVTRRAADDHATHALVAALLAAGADPHRLDDTGHAPLDDCVRLQPAAISALLLGAGANPTRVLQTHPGDGGSPIFNRLYLDAAWDIALAHGHHAGLAHGAAAALLAGGDAASWAATHLAQLSTT